MIGGMSGEEELYDEIEFLEFNKDVRITNRNGRVPPWGDNEILTLLKNSPTIYILFILSNCKINLFLVQSRNTKQLSFIVTSMHASN